MRSVALDSLLGGLRRLLTPLVAVHILQGGSVRVRKLQIVYVKLNLSFTVRRRATQTPGPADP